MNIWKPYVKLDSHTDAEELSDILEFLPYCSLEVPTFALKGAYATTEAKLMENPIKENDEWLKNDDELEELRSQTISS